MKKLFVITLVFVLCALCVACGNNSSLQETCEIDLNAMEVEGKGAQIDDHTVNITRGGLFDIIGSNSNVMIYVDTKDEVTLRLNQAGIYNPDGPALHIANAKVAYITVVNNTINHLSGGATYASDTAEATITSNVPTFVGGQGGLKIVGNYKTAVHCSDSLVLQDGNFTIESKEVGIKCDGKITINNFVADIYSMTGCGVIVEDGLAMNGGNISIVAYDDAVVSNKGDVVIDSGSVNVETSANGIIAKAADKNVAVNSGTLFVKSEKCGIDTAGDIVVGEGGKILIDGPSTRDFESLKCGGKVNVAGGTLMALSNGAIKPELADDSSPIFNINTGNQAIGSFVSVKDASGGEYVSHSSLRDFSYVTISSKGMSDDKDYKLYINDKEIYQAEN